MKKNIQLLFVSVFVIITSLNVKSQTVGCTGTSTDPGGAGNYANNANFTQTFCSDNGQPIYLIFTSFNTENNWDGLSIFDGNSTAAPLISSGLPAGSSAATCPAGSFYGTTSPGTVTATGTCITIRFTSDGSVNAAGWAATIGCGTPPPPPPPPVNNNCAGAIAITPGATCTATSATVLNATQSLAGCSGNANDDVWFSFVATGSAQQISVNAPVGFDPVVQLFSGSCASLTSLNCNDASYGSGANGSSTFGGLTAGQTYFYRVYDFGTGYPATSTFSTCATTPPPPPANDNCVSATSVTAGATCTSTSGTVLNATQSLAGCAGTANDDVWFSFVATGSTQQITVNAPAGFDPVVQLFSGTCASLTSMACNDASYGSGANGTGNFSGLTTGQTYYYRVYDYFATNPGTPTFSTCVIIPPPPGPGQACDIPNSFCSETIIYPAGTGGTVTAPAGPAYGCLGSQPNPAWFNMQVQTSGPMGFNISSTSDIDFIIWGPFANPTGACVAGLTAATIVDCSYSGTNNESALIPNAIAGEYYIVMITNFSGQVQDINFSQPLAGSPGEGLGNCDILCNITALTATPGACQLGPNTYDVTGTITTTEPPASGTLTISSSCGGTPFVMNAPFSTSMTYTITGAPSNGAACTITAVYSADASCTRTATCTAPAACGACTLTASNTGPYCEGATISLTASAVAGATYAWTGPNGFTGTGLTVTIPASTIAMAGTYSVTATAGPAVCTNTTSVVVNTIPVTTVNSETICSGSSATLTASGATSYTWNTGDVTTAITVNPTTTTNYTVTGNNAGCTSTATATVTVTTTPTVTVNSLTICSGGTAALTATGATNFTWSPATNLSATTGASVNSTSPNTIVYTVTGTDFGCSATATATVTVDPSVNLSVNSETICDGASTILTVNGATNYTWSPATGLSATTGSVVTANPTTTQTYIITGTSLTCSGTINSTVTVVPNPTITVNSPTICAGENGFLTASGATLLTWSPATNLSTTTGTDVTSNSPNTIIYTVTGIEQGCTSTATATLTVNPTPVLSVNSATYCEGGSDTLTVTGATTYVWTPATGLSSTTNDVVVANPTITTIYSISGAIGSCNATATTTVTVNANPIVDAGLNGVVCSGSSTTLLATGAFSYVWDTDPSLNNLTIAGPTASPTVTTTYSVTGTDVNGCIGNDVVTIDVPPVLILSADSIPTTCFGSSFGGAIVSVNPPAGPFAPYTYLWNTGSTTSFISQQPAGTYTVVVTDQASCNATATVTITEPPILTLVESTNTPVTCFGLQDGSSSVTANGGTPGSGYTYLWSPSGVTTPSNNTLSTGTYTVTATDVNGCIATTTLTITQPTVVNLSPVVGATICISQNTNLTATASGGNPGGYVYTWSDGTNILNGSTINVNPTTTTTYTVSAVDLVNNCPSNTQTVTVIVNPPLSIDYIVPAAICEGDIKTVDVTAHGGNGTHIFSWTPMTGVTIITPNASTVKLNPNTTIDYTVSVNDNCGTPAADTNFVLTINPKPVLTITPAVTSGCQPLEVSFSGNSSTTPVQCYWNFGNNSTSYICSPTYVFAEDGNYSISYNVTDINGCTNFTTSSVTVFPVPNAVFMANPQPTTIIDPEVTFIDITDGNIVNQTWFFNDSLGTYSGLASPSYIYSAPGEYLVTLAVQTDKGCVDTVSQPIVIEDYFVVYVPNSFSPDGDGINEKFTAYGNGITDFKMGVYDRWGGKIMETTDMEEGWDGKKSGTKVEKGVYIYRMEVINFLGERKLLSGHVNVVR